MLQWNWIFFFLFWWKLNYDAVVSIKYEPIKCNDYIITLERWRIVWSTSLANNNMILLTDIVYGEWQMVNFMVSSAIFFHEQIRFWRLNTSSTANAICPKCHKNNTKSRWIYSHFHINSTFGNMLIFLIFFGLFKKATQFKYKWMLTIPIFAFLSKCIDDNNRLIKMKFMGFDWETH